VRDVQEIDVFVSYAQSDRDRIQPLVAALENHGWNVWWDTRITPGMAFDREIESALNAARCIVVVWSRTSVESDWVRAEATEGLERGVLVPLIYDEVRPPLAFRRTQALVSGDETSGYNKLIDAVARFVAAPLAQSISALPQSSTGRHQSSELSNLPLLLPPFVGRDLELKALLEVVNVNRLTTIVGPAGTGKTRMAIRAAEELSSAFAGGTCFVELSSENGPAEILGALARAFSVVPEPGVPLINTLLNTLRYRPAFVVFDNCEHVTAPTAALAESLLQSCADLKIVATSREPLRALAERVFPLGPMQTQSLDDSVSDAVAFFIERARAEGAEPQQLEEDRPAIDELCSRLDGLPLAIELAAARVRSINPRQLVALLDERFRLLDVDRHPANIRHQTLRSAIDWSYESLGELEQTLFNRLSLFAGPFELKDAIAIGFDGQSDEIDILNRLSVLVDKSMLVTLTGNPLTYRLLETLRTYGAELLSVAGDVDALYRCHADYFASKAEGARSEIVGPNHVAVIDLLVTQTPEYRTATSWAISTGDPNLAVRLATGFCGASYFRIGYEALDWLPESASIVGESSQSSVLLGLLARSAVFGGDYNLGRELAERAVAIDPGPDSVQARAQLAMVQTNNEAALEWAESACAVAKPADDKLGVLLGLLLQGPILTRMDRVDEALRVGHELLKLGDECRSDHARGWGHLGLGIALGSRDSEASELHLDTAFRLGRSEKNLYLESNALIALLATHLAHDSPKTAAAAASKTLTELQGGWDKGYFTRRVLDLISEFLASRGRAEACEIDAYLETFSQLASSSRGAATRTKFLQSLKSELGQETIQKLRDSGARLDADEAIKLATSALAEVS